MKQRIITAIIMVLIGVPIVVYGNYPVLILGGGLSLVAVREMISMKDITTKTPIEIKLFTIIATLVIVFYSFDFNQLNYHAVTSFGLEIPAIFLFVLLLVSMIRKDFSLKDASYYLLTIFYVGLTFHALLFIRFLGLNLLLFMILIVAITDSGAYFCGKKFGKHKLAPRVSPNKTIEGSFGGTLLGVIGGTLFGSLTGISTHIGILMMISLVVAVVGQLGDLVASSMKREFGIKDFGNLFPGHGGVLDRFDSHL